jgi:Fibronectin type III domain
VASEGDFPAGGGGERKILGLKPKTAMIGGGIVLALAIGYLLWKRSQASAAATTAAADTTGTTDTSGSGIDYGGELSVIQSELEDMLAAEGTEPSTGTGTGSGTGTGTGSGTGSGSGSGSGGGTGTKTGPPPTATKPAKPGMPSGVHATKTTANAVTLAWNKAPNATSYRVRATYQGKLVGSQQTVNGTSATISGLHPDHTYTFHVASVGLGGTSAETNGPAVKTKL